MFRNKKVMVGLLAVLLGTVALGAPLSVAATAKLGHCPLADTPLGKLIMGGFGRLLVLRSELNVTDQQREKIHDILKGHKPELAGSLHVVWEKRNALRDAVLAEKPEEQAIRKAADELGKAIGDAAVVGSKIASEVKPVLTEQQRARTKKFRAENDEAVENFFKQAVKGQ